MGLHPALEKLIYLKPPAEGIAICEPHYLDYVAYVNWTKMPGFIMMHSHEDTAEITLMLRGGGSYTVGNHYYRVKEGDIIFCGSGIVHDAIPDAGGEYETLTLGIRNLQLPGLDFGQFLQSDQVPVFHQAPQFQELVWLFTMISGHAVSEAAEEQALCQMLMLSAMELVKSMIRQRPSLLPAMHSLCMQVEAYINEHFAEDLSLEDVAKHFYVSPYHLSHLFKEHTGYNFKQYIVRRRLGEAQQLLAATDARILQIAEQVGYSSPAYFTRLFVKQIGMTPKEYREYRQHKVEDAGTL